MLIIFRPIGYLLAFTAGILQLIFWFIAWVNWLGILGFFIGLILTPGVLIFPIIYWIVEGDFPTVYFLLMFIGFFGMRLAKRGSRTQ